MLVLLGRPKEALAALDRALALDPNRDEAWERKGEALAVLGRPKEALAAIEQALRLYSDVARYHSFKGVMLQELGRTAEAEQAFGKAREHTKVVPTIFRELGHVPIRYDPEDS